VKYLHSRLCSKEPASGSHSEPAMDPVCTFTTEISILKLSLRNTFMSSQTLPSLEVFRAEFSCFYSSMRFNCLANLILLGLLNSMLYNGGYNLCNSSICNVFHPPTFFPSRKSRYLLQLSVLNTFSPCSCFQKDDNCIMYIE
jgi:hypothetical protein